MKSKWLHRFLLGLPGIALAIIVVSVALESHVGDHLLIAAQGGVGMLLVWSVAVAVHTRYPERPLGILLFVLAFAYGLTGLIVSSNPVLFTLARLARPAVEVILLWIMLAFPSGRLIRAAERRLVWAGALALLLLWLPSVLMSSTPQFVGPFLLCQENCPRNILQIANRPDVASSLIQAFRVCVVFILLAAIAILFVRIKNATPLMRKVLAPVLVAGIFRLGVIAIVLVSDSSRMLFTLSFWAIPLAMALGLLRGRLYMAQALQRLVSGMRAHPDTKALRRMMATAIDDKSLEMAYWIKDSGRWVDELGQSVSLPYPNARQDRAATLVPDGNGIPVAALVYDAALLEEPSLVEAVAESMQLVLESHRMDTEIKSSQLKTLSAVEVERRRIERDLHDGAQQRLLAMRMKLAVAERLFDKDISRARELVSELGGDMTAAVHSLRDYAHGVVPPLLAEKGLAFALEELADRSGQSITTDIQDVGRFDPAIESAIYHCSVEALQNAAKHGGAGAHVTVQLNRSGSDISFCIANDSSATSGIHQQPQNGHGLENIRHRMSTVGGVVHIGHDAQNRFVVSGLVPINGGNKPQL